MRFADALPKMRKATSEHLRRERLDREKVLACIARVLLELLGKTLRRELEKAA